MKNVLQRINEVSANLQSLDSAKTRGQELQRLATRCQQLEIACQQLKKARDAEDILIKTLGTLPKTPRVSKQFISKLAELRALLEKDWVAFSANRDVPIKLIQPIDKFTDRLSEYLKSVWQKHLASVIPDLDTNSVDTLRNAGFKDEATRLAELLFNLNHAKRQLADSTEAVNRITEWALEAKGIIRNLDGLPEPAKRFLAKASHSGAAIDELTPEIREWLASKGMLDLFIIKTRT